MAITRKDSLIFALNGSEIILGRDSACDIQVSGIGVSRRHCSIELNPHAVVIKDLKSTFGVRINNIPISGSNTLSHGDVVTVGVQSLKIDLSETTITLVFQNTYSEENRTDTTAAIRIGRAPENEVFLSHPLVSRVHASVSYHVSGKLYITDHRSINGTFVNGVAVSSCPLNDGDIVQIGPYRLYLDNGKLVKVDDSNRIRIEICNVHVIKNGVPLLDNVNCVLPAGEFIAILGPSGAGKSTLVDSCIGKIPLNRGEILVNGLPLSRFLKAFSSNTGYLAQKTLLFENLTGEEALKEQCRLRLPHDSTEEERTLRIREITEFLDLSTILNTPICGLSGGEVRRLDLGIELLSSPALIFLDEPLSGLDPGLVKRFMALFRRISDQGHTLVLITHTLEQLELCDRIIFMNRGKIVFQGPPAELANSFNVKTIADVYEKTSLQSDVESRSTNRPHPPPSREASFHGLRKPPSISFFQQVVLLCLRYQRLSFRDYRTGMLLLCQPPVIALLMVLVFKNDARFLPSSFYFCLTISTIWIGGISTIRNIASEWFLLLRDYRAGLSLRAYVFSRLLIACANSVLLAALFYFSLIIFFTGFDLHSQLYFLLYTGIVSGAVLGLCISACSENAGRAVTWLPLIYIPQVFFSGILIPFDRMNEIGSHLSYLTVSRPLFTIFRRICILKISAGITIEWLTLFFLLTGLIILTKIAVNHHIVDR